MPGGVGPEDETKCGQVACRSLLGAAEGSIGPHQSLPYEGDLMWEDESQRHRKRGVIIFFGRFSLDNRGYRKLLPQRSFLARPQDRRTETVHHDISDGIPAS